MRLASLLAYAILMMFCLLLIAALCSTGFFYYTDSRNELKKERKLKLGQQKRRNSLPPQPFGTAFSIESVPFLL